MKSTFWVKVYVLLSATAFIGCSVAVGLALAMVVTR